MNRAGGRLAAGCTLAVGLLVGFPSVALADAAGPTDYRSEIVSITPDLGVIEVSTEGGDAFVRLTVDPGHEAVVLGYDGEPYVHIDIDGTVERNRRSFATYYNEDRFGRSEIPDDIVDNEATPEWIEVGSGGSWAWHDHRAHWMGDDPPIGLQAGQSLPLGVVPIVVDDQPVQVGIITTLQDEPSPWPAAFGLVAGLLIVMVGVRMGPATTTLSSLILSLAALVVGIAQYTSLPAETGPLVTWWLLPASATACSIAVIMLYGRSAMIQSALVALAGLQLLVWGAARRTTLTRAVLPTDLPFWFDRVVTASTLTGGAVLVIAALRQMFPTGAPAEQS